MLDFERKCSCGNNAGKQLFFNQVSSVKVMVMQDTLNKIRVIEDNIKKIDPNFKSSINKVWFESIRN